MKRGMSRRWHAGHSARSQGMNITDGLAKEVTALQERLRKVGALNTTLNKRAKGWALHCERTAVLQHTRCR